MRGKPRRTVVLHPGALGDVLLSIPALRALRTTAGEELVLAAQPRIGALLTSLGVVDRHLDFDTLGLEALFTDAAPPSRLRELLAGACVVSWFGAGDGDFARGLRVLAPAAIVSSTRPATEGLVWRHLLASVGGPDAAGGDEPVEVPPALVEEGRRALAGAGWTGARPLVMLHPGAGGAAKRWSPDGFAAVAGTLVESAGVDLVVHAGPADHEAAAALRARLRVSALALADPPLDVLAGALGHCALWIGNDSGVGHLAAALGAPTLALFAEANLAWRPWARGARQLVIATGAAAPAPEDVTAVVAEASAVLAASARRPVGARTRG